MHKAPPPDQAQRDQCLDVAQSFIVQAPAGSGKTTLLTQRFLHLLCEVDAPSDVVAITFTRKAAAEMRERIVGALLHAKEGDVAARALTHHLDRAGVDLRNAPDRIRVMTFDSLFLSLARQMPFESGLSTDTAPMDNIAPLAQAAAQASLAATVNASAAKSVLTHLDARLDTAVSAVASLLGARDQWLGALLQVQGQSPAELREVVHREIGSQLSRIHSVLRQKIPTAQLSTWLNAAEVAQRQLQTDVFIGSALPDCTHDALPQWLAFARVALTKGGEVRKSINVNDGIASHDKAIKQSLQSLWDHLRDTPEAVDALGALHALPQVDDSAETWQLLMDTLHLLLDAAGRLRVEMVERNVTDFTTPAMVVAGALAEEGSAMRLNVAQSIRHLLVDEFQDTSRMQFHFLEGVAQAWGQFGHGDETLFCVGDPMQSIYRFRQADVSLFAKAQASGIGGKRLQSITLSTNFRSTDALVSWVNTAVGTRFSAESVLSPRTVAFAPSLAYQASLAPAAPPNAQHVALTTFASADEELAHVTKTIVDWRTRTEPYARIGVLVQAARHGEAVAQELQACGIDVATDALRPANQLPWVQDLLTLAYAVSEPEDRLTQLAVLRGPWCGMRLKDLTAVAERLNKEPGTTLWSLVDAALAINPLSEDGAQRWARFASAAAPCVAALGFRPLAVVIDSLWHRLNVAGCHPDFSASVFAQVMDCIRAASAEGTLLDREQLEVDIGQIRPTNRSDAPVQVMTIHKAKGLEFDAVILPFSNRRGRRDDSPLVRFAQFGANPIAVIRPASGDRPMTALFDWLNAMEAQAQDQERTRLLYVAVTRAKRALCITASSDAGGSSARISPTLWGALSPEISFPAALPRARNPLARPIALPLVRVKAPAPIASSPPPERFPPQRPDPQEIIARAVGTTLHAWLAAHGHRGVWGEGAKRWALDTFSAAGLLPEVATHATSKLGQMIERMRGCVHAAWIWSESHARSYDELALGVADAGLRGSHVRRPDRVFETPEGEGWVVDYKTASPSTQDSHTISVFIEAEKARYHEDMMGYMEAVAQAHVLPGAKTLRAGLYFPAIGVFTAYEAVKKVAP